MTLSDALHNWPWLLISLAMILGLLVGSFLNVVIHRLPLMMQRDWRQQCLALLQLDEKQCPLPDPVPAHPRYDLIKPDSHCPGCGTAVRAWQNIPIISYLLLRGRCAGCQKAISARYPIIEGVSAVLSGIIAWQFGAEPITAFLLLFTWALLALTMIDFDHQLLPDDITLPLLWLGLVLAGLDMGLVSATDAVLGAAAGYLTLWGVYWGFRLLTGKEGMGYGDFKLLAALGAWLGWQQLLIIILLSSIVGAVVGISLMLIRGRDHNLPIPFGPYLAGAGFLALLAGDWLLAQYYNLLLGAL